MDSHEKKLLFDVLESGRSIRSWCKDASFAKYETDRQFRRAVEREFEIIGEALNRLSRTGEATASKIEELPRIIGFRTGSSTDTTPLMTLRFGASSSRTSHRYFPKWKAFCAPPGNRCEKGRRSGISG